MSLLHRGFFPDMGRCRHTHTHAGRQVGTLALPQALSSLQANPNPCLRIIFPSELYIVEVLRKEFGKNTEVALENVFGVLLPSEKGSLKASPVLPSQHNRSPRDAPSCPGNVLPGHAVSSSLRLPVLLGLASLAAPAKQLCGEAQLALGTGAVTEGPAPKGRTFLSPGFRRSTAACSCGCSK